MGEKNLNKIGIVVLLLAIIPFLSSYNFEEDDGFNFPSDTTSSTSCSCTAYPTFTSLTDTPNSYLGQGGNCVKVAAGETELEFGACAGGSENDPFWSANFTLYNSSWSSTYNSTYDAYNSTGFIKDWNASGWIINWSQVISSSGIDLATLLGFNYWNDTYATFNKTYADTLYSPINEPLWTSNFTAYNSSWSSTYNSTYDAYNSTGFIKDWNATGYIKDWGISGSSNYAPTNINLTQGTHNGDIENGTYTGYEAGDEICNLEYSGSHFCTEFEVALYQGDDINGEDAWIIAGSPKYIPATVPVNDCQGWTYSGTATALGNYWHFNSTGKGEGRALNCATTLKLACCSY